MKEHEQQLDESRPRTLQELRSAIAQIGLENADAQESVLADYIDAQSPTEHALSTILGRVALFDVRMSQEKEAIEQLVASAREQGARWADVAEALEIATPSAYRRFDSEARQRHSDYRRRPSAE